MAGSVSPGNENGPDIYCPLPTAHCLLPTIFTKIIPFDGLRPIRYLGYRSPKGKLLFRDLSSGYVSPQLMSLRFDVNFAISGKSWMISL
jgi:hypothetical protein